MTGEDMLLPFLDEPEPETLRAPPVKPRGFAALTPERRRAISMAGGRAAHAKGTAHRFTKEEAREAGKKGGVAPHRSRGRASG